MFVSCDEQFSTRNSTKKSQNIVGYLGKRKQYTTYFSIFILAHNLKDVPTFDLKYINE